MPGRTRWSQVVNGELWLVAERVSAIRYFGGRDGESSCSDIVARVRDGIVERIGPV